MEEFWTKWFNRTIIDSKMNLFLREVEIVSSHFHHIYSMPS